MARYCGCRRRGGTNHPRTEQTLAGGEWSVHYHPDGMGATYKFYSWEGETYNKWIERWRHRSPGPWNYGEPTHDREILFGPLEPGASYDVQAAKWLDDHQVSDWSDTKILEVP